MPVDTVHSVTSSTICFLIIVRCMFVVRCKGCNAFRLHYMQHRKTSAHTILRSVRHAPKIPDGSFLLPSILFIGIQQFVVDSLPFSDIENIKKFRQRFRIIRTWTSSDNDWICLTTVYGCASESGLNPEPAECWCSTFRTGS